MMSREELVYYIESKIENLSNECLNDIWYAILKDEGKDYGYFRSQIQKEKNRQLNLLEYTNNEKIDSEKVERVLSELSQYFIENSKCYNLSDKEQKKEYYKAIKKAENNKKGYMVFKNEDAVDLTLGKPSIKDMELKDFRFHEKLYDLSEIEQKKEYYSIMKKYEKKKRYRIWKHGDVASISTGSPKQRKSKYEVIIKIRQIIPKKDESKITTGSKKE